MTSTERILEKVGLTREDIQRLSKRYRLKPAVNRLADGPAAYFDRHTECGNRSGYGAYIADMQYNGCSEDFYE